MNETKQEKRNKIKNNFHFGMKRFGKVSIYVARASLQLNFIDFPSFTIHILNMDYGNSFKIQLNSFRLKVVER